MRYVARMAALALAAGGIGLVGCEGEAEVETTDAGAEVQRDVERAGERVARETEQLGEDARAAGAEMQDQAGQAAEAAERETREAGRELGQAADDAARQAEQTGRDTQGTLQTGAEGTAMAPDAEGIRDVLASATEAALTEDGFDDLVERLVDADRNRIGSFIRERDNFDDLNQKVQLVAQKYQSSFGGEFDIADEGQVYSQQFAAIRQGEVEARPAAATIDDPDANRDAGRNIASVRINRSHNLPELTVNMVHEFPDSWRIDLPDDVTGQKLHENLSRALDELASDDAQWPDDKTDAQRYITHRLLLAMHGREAR